MGKSKVVKLPKREEVVVVGHTKRFMSILEMLNMDPADCEEIHVTPEMAAQLKKCIAKRQQEEAEEATAVEKREGFSVVKGGKK